MYDEKKAVENIRKLPPHIKMHLSHVFRNGLCLIMAAIDCENRKKAWEQAMKLGGKMEEMGL